MDARKIEQILRANNIPPAPEPPIHAVCRNTDIPGGEWWVLTEKGWYWLDPRKRVWLPCHIGP